MDGALGRGRKYFGARAWQDAWQAFTVADRSQALEGEDLERLAVSAYMCGRDREFQAHEERVQRLHLAAGEPARAARACFWLALSGLLLGETGAASGWLSQAHRLVQDIDCVERGYLLLPLAEQQLARAQADHALATASSAVAIGERFADADLIALARHLQGRGLICSRQIEAGLAHLDEAMLAVVGGLVSPLATGLVYCSVLEACRQVYAFDRAREWTTALARWCEGQPQMVAFTGACRVHRAEVMQLNGDWPAAFSEARRACERPAPDGGRAPPGAAFYQQGEVHRLRGAWSAAEEAFRLASRYGCEPQPGLALLRLGEGRSDAAVAMIRRLVQGAVGPDRLRLLPAAVQILAAAGMAGEARQASEELDALAAGLAKGALAAIAAYADGIVALVEGRPESALVSLRRALAQWQAVAAPYEEARVRLLLARACDLLGDCDGRDLELQAARETFEALGALPDIVRIESMCAAAAPPALRSAHRLSRRELQVLRLVATGKTNKAIGQQLGLSERTIDRHVGNILDKLDVQSRAAATAYAYEHALIAPSPE